ncbi:hypothetical protein LSH36_385g02079 [Paralvinella palmiformis]|uniref:Uncharacterized protein n=1 Tax=Paralvinella palmiformis TaxID=53620 RepID=A0AAD9JCW9_9ANNE|nr:hypothetical protein LSH36_385g02079 [Paralvinella palmiformis]
MFIKEGLIWMLIVVLTSDPVYGEFSIVQMLKCIKSHLDLKNEEEKCPYRKMKMMFFKWKQINCENCQYYFQCISNYKAIYGCQNSETNKRATTIIRDCSVSAGLRPITDQGRAAESLGRNGGNCAAKYLCDSNCNYNPQDNTCTSSNCYVDV